MDGNGNGNGHAVNERSGEENGGAQCQSVKVGLHIRPLISSERQQGCNDCIAVVPGKPQVQIGTHSFTFDHVYGSTGSPSSMIFGECVAPLVDGLFQGYNATVLAYGQTGSGKTYTMGTGYAEGEETGIIPQVMEAIFKKIETLKNQAEFQLRVSFIEILKEEVHDLLDTSPSSALKADAINGLGGKTAMPGKAPIQIRETSNGVITLAGSTEVDVTTQKEMAACLAQGSLARATGSTNMNSQSSRSHAIFTITIEQMRKWDAVLTGETGSTEDGGEDFLCAKLHLVDLAGSERAKRTGADGLRLKEGIHINKGLLALGNVISALGDEKKRKEGVHVPYRDSKLTRLLQDSLGGNSRTVMIACVSPADINAEETLNTLKYANRARNIQNKPIVNRDPMTNEIQRMRQQLEYLQSELLCARAGGGVPSNEAQVLKQKISWLEASNAELYRELQECRNKSLILAQHAMEAEVERSKLSLKLELLRNGKSWKEIDDINDVKVTDLPKSCLPKIHYLETEIQNLQSIDSLAVDSASFVGLESNRLVSSDRHFTDGPQLMEIGRMILGPGEESREVEEEVAKEWEHNLLQDTMDKELHELNKRLEQKETEMKLFGKVDTAVLKQHFGKKLMELEEEKKTVQKERDRLLAEVESLANTTDGQTQKMQEVYLQKLKMLETQISDLRKKQENQVQLIKQKQRSDEAAKRLQEEIQFIKAQKVQLQNKIKQEAEQFRCWKASREKELLQLRKEGRRNEYEMHKLQALNQRQKLVLQRKTEEASMATKRLKELLEGRKSSPRENLGHANGNASVIQSNDKALQRCLEHELEVIVHVHEVRTEYQKQTEMRAAIAKELTKIKQEDEIMQKGLSPQHWKNGSPVSSSTLSMSPNARNARIGLLESMLNASSSTLVAMASQLSEAEERERAFIGRGRWNQLRTMGDAKSLLQYLFNTAACARCQLWDKDIDKREMKETITELGNLLRQSEFQRKEIEKQQRLREQAVAIALATASSVGSHAAIKNVAEENSGHSSVGSISSKRLQYTANLSSKRNSNISFEMRKAVSMGPVGGAKIAGGQTGKLWRWKRSHQQWMLQFKWKWQKPWRLSEWIRHNDETMTRVRPRGHTLLDMA
ncbi:hypothetical protein SUGI_0741660 [Cryptomeria japonica]|uniref:kinesin-like protein KIN-4A isoform X2 n=1 Tax=Cryptomeria japonica TaxID=3369 RepID=UPI0024147392|nr:kinesin-like protein KIN-4A isoform X2 [Cryptomeria japonica]GLJ36782.1 hypothetical protein SUGI_0741660 [Cryptomeria japonica]